MAFQLSQICLQAAVAAPANCPLTAVLSPVTEPPVSSEAHATQGVVDTSWITSLGVAM